MTEPQAETAAGPIAWLQDELYQLKSEVAQLGQQQGHLRALASDMSEAMHLLEAALREASLGARQVPRLQEEINQAVALIVQLQDQQKSTEEQLAAQAQRRRDGEGRDQQELLEFARRLEQLEREVSAWRDRQAGVDEVGRRFQEGLSVVRHQLQQIEQRVEGTESKAARGLEGANRAEHTLTEVEATILGLQREDETIAERARVASEVAHRLESVLNERMHELERLEMLAERIELHRAERQRLEDRAARLEEEMAALHGKAEQQDQDESRLRGRHEGLASRVDSLQEQMETQRTAMFESLRKVLGSESRTKRRQIQELEREIREMTQHVAGLTDQ